MISSQEACTQLEQPLQNLSEENLSEEAPTDTCVPSAPSSHTELDSDDEDIEDGTRNSGLIVFVSQKSVSLRDVPDVILL